ncbi:hypothetical protein JAO73_13800 [Hymenobacter sp. BT523]|uniref:hypothetical protein n=1 Tax=Hymenobacter sp. BT523 TaxID=2795725 RepID=UPI0018EC867F|nr:hypothetical protein [Hymenobacter sp. BT523]MBJ6110092.1 hypothetical protein [Hymenobacter sp. BT523]
MKTHIIKICTLALLSASTFSCKKDYGNNLGPLQDSVTDNPVTVTNANAFERFPVVYTSVAAGGTFTINFAIPADKGKIKQITKVATSSTVQSLSYTNLNSTAASTSYRTAPIPGNGTNTISFTSNLNEYLAYRIRVGTTAGPIGPNAGTPPAPTIPVPSTTATPTDIAFYFNIMLEDGSTIVPLPVRVRVQP